MDKTEVALGASVFLLMVLSIWLFIYGVVPSEKYLGNYTYGSASDFSEALLALLILGGVLGILHAARSRGFIEAD